jgi:HEAT repeat protein
MNNETKPLRKLSRACPYGELSEEEIERLRQQDPLWYARREEEELNRQDAMVVQALREQALLDVESVYDLVNTAESYPEAIPVLLELLPQISHPDIKEGIVRALTVKEARGIAARPLIEEFKKIDVPATVEEASKQGVAPRLSLKWTIGNALSVVADKSVLEEIVAIMRDRRHGEARQQLFLFNLLTRLKPAGVADLLMELLDDDTVVRQVIMALGRLRVQEARPRLEAFLDHPEKLVRQVAKEAIERIDKAKAK